MVKYSEPRLDRLFTALGEPVRRQVVTRLAEREMSLSELSQPFAMTMPAVMKHLKVLEEAGIVSSEKRGRVRYCRLEPQALEPGKEWIVQTTEFWKQRLEALTKFLEEEAG